MKRKFISVLMLIVVLVLAMACFVGCGDEEGGSVKASVIYSDQQSVVIKIDEKEDNATLIDAMKTLRSEGKFSFESSTSQYGEMITSVNGLVAEGTYYWACYTTDDEIADTATTITIDGKVYYYALVGASMLEVKTGECYVWVHLSWA